jgi:hypothetical protein
VVQIRLRPGDPLLREGGVRRVGTVDTPDGPAVYMLCERREFGAADAAPGAGTGA